MRSATVTGSANSTLAVSVAKVTLDRTPSTRLSRRCTRAAHEAQVMPPMASWICCVTLPSLYPPGVGGRDTVARVTTAEREQQAVGRLLRFYRPGAGRFWPATGAVWQLALAIEAVASAY